MMGTQEEWKPVEGYEGLYEVSDLGRVKSLHRGKERILKPQPSKKSYLQVRLYKNRKWKMHRVHILVMEAFVGKCPKGHQVDHIDWNPENNMLDNLRYLPAKENDRRKSPEWRRKNAEAMKKLHQDPEWQKNNAEALRRLAQDPNWRKNVSEAAKKLHKDPEYLRKNAEATRKANRKPVDQYTLDGIFVKTWESATDAARELGISKSYISICCTGKYKSAGGFIWRFA